MQHSQYEQFNPFRSPSWRAERAQALLAQPPKRPSHSRDDEYVHAYYRFLRRWKARGDDRCRRSMASQEQTAILYAFDLYHLDSHGRSLLQARLLARQTPEEIAHLLGTLPAAIDMFEKLFFDVRDCLDQRDYMIMTIRGRADEREKNQREITLKMLAYYGGRDALEAQFSGLRQQPIPSGPAEAEDWLDKAFASQLQRHGMMAAQAIDPNSHAIQLVKIYARMIKAGQRSQSDQHNHSGVQANIDAALRDFSWASGRAGYEQLASMERESSESSKKTGT